MAKNRNVKKKKKVGPIPTKYPQLVIKPSPRYQCFWYSVCNNPVPRQEAVKQITEFGYQHVPTCNGGDDDILMIDTERKEWAWWEGGFSPFYSHFSEDRYPTDGNLREWHENSS